MKYLLDTNVCIKYLNGSSPRIETRLRIARPGDCVLCAVAVGELYYGAYKSNRIEENLNTLDRFVAPFVCLPFDEAASRRFGRLRASLERIGRPIGGYDMQIAAIALDRGLIVVTNNTREFARVPGLAVEDWEDLDEGPEYPAVPT